MFAKFRMPTFAPIVSGIGAGWASVWASRHQRLRRWFLAAFATALLLSFGTWFWFHWADPDRDYKFTNFLAAFLPFPVSVFIAFVPDMEKAEKMRPVWRVAIVAIGIVYSLVLWHQQSVNIAASHRDQESIVSSAVSQSNGHSDRQLDAVKRQLSIHTEEQVNSVRNDLKKTSDAMAEEIKNSVAEITDGVSKATGIPLKPPRLQFSFVGTHDPTEPLLRANASMQDGVARVKFTVVDVTDTSAQKVEIWIRLCDDCKYAKEPDGFRRLSGMSDRDRYRVLEALNPGIFMEDMEVAVKPPAGVGTFDVGWIYDCPVCVHKREWQIFTVSIPQASVASGAHR